MNDIRKTLCLLLAIVLVAFALPSVAAPQFTKLYKLALTSDGTTPLTVVASLTNKATGPGNSNIGSFRYVFSGATINSAATIAANPAIPPGNIQVSGSTVTVIVSTTPIKAGKTLDFKIVLNDCGDGISLPQSGVTIWAGNQSSTTFSPTETTFPLSASVVCGSLACAGSENVPNSFAPGSVTVTRDDIDKNGNNSGDACAGIPYTYTSLTATNELHFFWSLATNSAAAWEYTVRTAGGTVPAAGTTGIAWLNNDGSPVTDDPAFLTGNDLGDPNALNCIGLKVLPFQYGTLHAAITEFDSSLTIDGVAAADVPGASFPIVIINSDDPTKTERLTAVFPPTVTSGPPGGPFNLTYNVTRGTATEGFSTPAPHAALKPVVSSPLPILPVFPGGPGSLPPYVEQTQAQGCIADQGVIDPGIPGLHFTTFIDIGDNWGSQP